MQKTATTLTTTELETTLLLTLKYEEKHQGIVKLSKISGINLLYLGATIERLGLNIKDFYEHRGPKAGKKEKGMLIKERAKKIEPQIKKLIGEGDLSKSDLAKKLNITITTLTRYLEVLKIPRLKKTTKKRDNLSNELETILSNATVLDDISPFLIATIPQTIRNTRNGKLIYDTFIGIPATDLVIKYNLSRQRVHQIFQQYEIPYTKINSFFEAAKEQKTNHSISERVQPRTELVNMLHARKEQLWQDLEKKEGKWPIQKAREYFSRYKYVDISQQEKDLPHLITLFQIYQETAEQNGFICLQDLATKSGYLYASKAGKILEAVHLAPFGEYRNSTTTELQRRLEICINATAQGFGIGEISYYLNRKYMTIMQHFSRNNIPNPHTKYQINLGITGQRGPRKMPLIEVAKVYESLDSGFTSDELPILLPQPGGFIKTQNYFETNLPTLIKERDRIEAEITTILKSIFQDDTITKAYWKYNQSL